MFERRRHRPGLGAAARAYTGLVAGARTCGPTLALSLVVLLASAGCGSSNRTRLQLDPADGPVDQPWTMTASGLPANKPATLTVEATDQAGRVWRSRTSYTADAHGDVRTGDGSSIASMKPVSGAAAGQLLTPTPGHALTFRFTLSGPGETTASATQVRDLPAEDVRVLHRSATGFDGVLYQPHDDRRHPAVLIIGGSEGGNSGVLLAAALASHGFAALSVAYFQGAQGAKRYPDLPRTLTSIPIEYFAGAAAWLGRQPSVERDHLWVSGASRGSEAALLVGTLRPDLVHGVLALSPTNSAQCSYTGARNACDHGAWSWHGKPVPYTRDWNVVQPQDNPAAVIEVEKISGPVLAVCGESDLLWDACPYSRAIMSRLTTHRRPFPHEVLAYPNAGHFVDVLVPYLPYVTGDGGLPTYGTTADANAEATAQAWPRVVAFLTEHSR